jgi:flagellar assembly protein FliH
MSESFSNFKVKSLDPVNAYDIKPFELKNLKTTKLTSFKTPTLKNSVSEYVKDNRFDYDPLIKDLLVQVSAEDAQMAQVMLQVEKKLLELKDKTLSESHAQGHAEGFKAGESEAKEKFEIEYKNKIASLNQLIEGFEKIKPEVMAAQEKFFLDAIFKITEQVIKREIQSDKEYLARTIHDVLEKVESREQLRILVSESQLQTIYSILPDLEKQYTGLKNISIDPSQNLGPFDVVLETDWNRVDATLDSQLESFKQLMSGKNES